MSIRIKQSLAPVRYTDIHNYISQCIGYTDPDASSVSRVYAGSIQYATGMFQHMML